SYPAFEIKWFPISEINKKMSHMKEYIDVIKEVSSKCDEFVIACDYDIEGEVIGYNVLRFACGKQDAKRMKFSTLTKQELINSFENAEKTIDWGQAHAGLARHNLDWLYGINLSRALMSSISKTGRFKVMSIGRVQGPSLKIITDREKEIQDFLPEKYWNINIMGTIKQDEIQASHEKDKVWEKEEAERIFNKVNGKNGTVDEVSKAEKKIWPPFPFDLTTLQTEAYRNFRLNPKKTLEIAQQLYLGSYISYPRTSSQKIPPSIGYKKIITSLSKNPKYAELASELLSKNSLRPNNGKKEDPAHPAIYPTGISLKTTDALALKVYDLIVKRFLASFGDIALRESMNIRINIEGEAFITKAVRTKQEGWLKLYQPYSSLKDEQFCDAEEKDAFTNKKTDLLEKETQPPKRYTQSSLIKELEKRNLGTKATRAQIVDTLYQRQYVKNDPLEATDFGIKTIKILEKYSPKIIDEELTKHFEEDMEKIREKKKNMDETIEESKAILKDILHDFKSKEEKIGNELKNALYETSRKEIYFGKCPRCKKGDLILKNGKFGTFIACSEYPGCKLTLTIPGKAKAKYAEEQCQHCGFPLVIIKYPRKKGENYCINPECPEKKKNEEKDKGELNELNEKAKQRKCPKCGTPLVARKSIHGYFFACPKFPKCRHIENIN
ncbi:MAG TPA: DNA topoisomerase I, partial [Candidatus Woesearchaeota archaeon]|nr:DNA topoisomerase I [Candidatus Woesearchaeota archaeon]